MDMEAFGLLASRQNVHGSMKPPPGVIPNFVDPESKAYRVVNANIVCIVIGTFFLIARIASRSLISHSLGRDDCMS